MSIRNIALIGRGFQRADLVSHLDVNYWRKNGLWHRYGMTFSEGVRPNTTLCIAFRGVSEHVGNINTVYVWPNYILQHAVSVDRQIESGANIYLPEIVDWERFIERCIKINE